MNEANRTCRDSSLYKWWGHALCPQAAPWRQNDRLDTKPAALQAVTRVPSGQACGWEKTLAKSSLQLSQCSWEIRDQGSKGTNVAGIAMATIV